MTGSEDLAQARKLLAERKFKEALDSISDHIDAGNHENEAYILMARALDGLGRIAEAHDYFSMKINWKNPSGSDLEMVKLSGKAAESNGWNLVFHRFNYIYNVMCQNSQSAPNKEDQGELEACLQRLADNAADPEIFLKLTWLYFACNDIVKSAFYMMAYQYFCPDPTPIDELESGRALAYFPNTSDIYTYLSKENDHAVVFAIENNAHIYEYEKMAQTLALMNRRAFFITTPIIFDVGEKEYKPAYFLNLSYANMKMVAGVNWCTPFLIRKNGIEVENTTLPLLDKLAKGTGNHLPVFAERCTLDNLTSDHVSRKEIHYVCNGFEFDNAPACTCFAYLGGYENYLSKLYNVNVIRQIKAESKCAISIVLPVRNNVSTLQYTLKTCLEQRFNDYEIVVSDNSDEGNEAVRNLVKAVDSEKIKYYKTPRKLPISKSFEYAYLRARGEYLVPIGADDAILPHGLATINTVLKRHSGENILLWDRLHYIWPDFIIRPLRNKFVIPGPYIPEYLSLKKVNCREMLRGIIQHKQSIYAIPLAYINSSIKRSYLLKMLEKTGAILDGASQDVYTGIVNLAINEEYLHLHYPITIAGLSSNSAGGGSLAGVKSPEKQRCRADEYLNTNCGYHADRNLEFKIPISDGDTALVVTSIFRLIDMQCIDAKVLDFFDWKKTFWKIAEQLQKEDINLESILLRLLDAASDISPRIHKWLDGEISAKRLRFRVNDSDSNKTYHRGFSANQALNLDASMFGITNVYDASKFASKLLNL